MILPILEPGLQKGPGQLKSIVTLYSTNIWIKRPVTKKIRSVPTRPTKDLRRLGSDNCKGSSTLEAFREQDPRSRQREWGPKGLVLIMSF